MVISIFVTSKWVMYKMSGWHYYMMDICYQVNFALFLFLQFFSKNDYLFKTMFFLSNGCLAMAVGAFRNQMVFHKIDNMSSLMLHMFPQLAMWNLRWNTMPYEETLKQEDRRFGNLDTNFTVMKMLVCPILFYFLWVSIYFSVTFILAKERIKRRNYDNMYQYYQRLSWSSKLLNRASKYGEFGGPLLFVFLHFLFFLFGHMFSILCFYSYYYHTFCILLWLVWSIWNASCFYMNYFA